MKVSQNKNSNQINWSKTQLVISEIPTIVITDGCHGIDTFSGTILQSKDESFIGAHGVEFRKASFKLYTGEITLSND